MLPGGCDDMALHSAAELVGVPEQCAVHRQALLHGGIRKPLGHPGAVGLIGHLVATLRQVVLTSGILDVRQELRTLAHERQPPSEQSTSGPHGGGRDIRRWEHAATEQASTLVGIALVMFRCATMEGFHREGLPEDKGEAFLSAEIGEPIPGKHAGDGHNETVPRGRDRLEKRCWTGFPVAVHHHLPVLLQETDVHGPGMQVDATVKLMWFGVESHEVSSSFMSDSFLRSAYHGGLLRRGPQ
jgi:hypothetical protein